MTAAEQKALEEAIESSLSDLMPLSDYASDNQITVSTEETNTTSNLTNTDTSTPTDALKVMQNLKSYSTNGLNDNSKVSYNSSNNTWSIQTFLDELELNKRRLQFCSESLEQENIFQGPVADFCIDCYSNLEKDIDEAIGKFAAVETYIEQYVPSMYKEADEAVIKAFNS